MPTAQVFRRGQIGTPLYYYAWRWKRVRSVFGTLVAAVPVTDGILQRAVNLPEQNHTSRPLNTIFEEDFDAHLERQSCVRGTLVCEKTLCENFGNLCYSAASDRRPCAGAAARRRRRRGGTETA